MTIAHAESATWLLSLLDASTLHRLCLQCCTLHIRRAIPVSTVGYDGNRVERGQANRHRTVPSLIRFYDIHLDIEPHYIYGLTVDVYI